MNQYSSPNQGVEALFVDLDETLFEGTVTKMTDQEVANAPLIDKTVRQIEKTRAMGGKVIMLTRNDEEAIHRFYNAKPEAEAMFDESVACLGMDKSLPLSNYLKEKRIDASNALFVDDTISERNDVTSRADVLSVDPNELN